MYGLLQTMEHLLWFWGIFIVISVWLLRWICWRIPTVLFRMSKWVWSLLCKLVICFLAIGLSFGGEYWEEKLWWGMRLFDVIKQNECKFIKVIFHYIHHIISCHLSYHIIPCHVMSYRIVSYHIILHYIILLYYIILYYILNNYIIIYNNYIIL